MQEYLADLNATRAAIAAGYSERTAEVLGYQLLQNPLVQEAIAKGKADLAKRAAITQERVIAEIARVAFADLVEAFDEQGRLLPIRKMPEHIRRTISSIKVRRTLGEENIIEIKTWSKDSALEKLCRHLGLYADETINLNLASNHRAERTVQDLTEEELLAIAAEGKK